MPSRGPRHVGARYGSAAAAVLALCAAAQSGAQRARFAVPELGGPARVECAQVAPESGPRCRVDLATYIGWRVFEAHCATCHAADGLGSDFAPALADRVAGMSRDEFFDMLERGYGGGESVLPAWGENRDVAEYADALWVYLDARARGILPPGPLERIGEPEAD